MTKLRTGVYRVTEDGLILLWSPEESQESPSSTSMSDVGETPKSGLPKDQPRLSLTPEEAESIAGIVSRAMVRSLFETPSIPSDRESTFGEREATFWLPQVRATNGDLTATCQVGMTLKCRLTSLEIASPPLSTGSRERLEEWVTASEIMSALVSLGISSVKGPRQT